MSFLLQGEPCPLPVFPLCSPCPLCETCLIFKTCQLKSWRSQHTKPRDPPWAAWERRTLVRHVFSSSGRALSLASFSSVFSVPSVRTLFFKTRTKAYRAVAKRRSAYAALPKRGNRGVTNGTPRSPSCFLYAAMYVFSVSSVFSVRKYLFALQKRHGNLKVGVPRKPDAIKCGVPKTFPGVRHSQDDPSRFRFF
ncbi:MAG: hypothetical protein BWX67_00667 [Thermotogae bacterium ADurb.Bin062]|nr:MAG: hypothetical protein BWX67_00667 [Thermotogota bacterium ADurb.Bin062]